MPKETQDDQPDLANVDFFLQMADSPIAVTKAFDPQTKTDPTIRGVGSSNIVDADGDHFHPTALDSIQKTLRPGKTTYRNHSFRVPEDVIGSVRETDLHLGMHTKGREYTPPKSRDDANYAELILESDVEMENPPAARTFRFIQKGREFGWSVGVIYKSYKPRHDRSRGIIRGFDVFDCEGHEASVVAMPNNPSTWIECARKSLVRKGIIPPTNDDPVMAYVIRNWSDFPDKEAVMIRRWAERMFREKGLVLAEPDDLTKRKLWAMGYPSAPARPEMSDEGDDDAA